MATTLEAFAGAHRHNYCILPTVDVEILPDIRHCECGEPVSFDQSIGFWGGWVHTAPDVPDHGRVAVRLRCKYCNSEDQVRSEMHAWFDATECDRCGGVDGHAIGD